jgi:hypothetical protein
LAFSIFSWIKANFEKLPAFVGGVVDFGTLASATNLAKMLVQDSCTHVKGVKEKDLGGPSDLRATSRGMRRLVRNFMKSFWVNFGRVEARSMAEIRRAEVGFLVLVVFCLHFLYCLFYFCILVLFCQEAQKMEAAHGTARAQSVRAT